MSEIETTENNSMTAIPTMANAEETDALALAGILENSEKTYYLHSPQFEVGAADILIQALT